MLIRVADSTLLYIEWTIDRYKLNILELQMYFTEFYSPNNPIKELFIKHCVKFFKNFCAISSDWEDKCTG